MSAQEGDTVWDHVSGINASGREVLADLRDLVAGRFSQDEQVDLMVELFREGAPTTAGYAAVPILLQGSFLAPWTNWMMAHTAGLILGARGEEGNPPVPPELEAHQGPEVIRAAIQRILESAAGANLTVAELLDSFSVVLKLKGEPDLAGSLLELALKKYGCQD
jgi:hypothetical protein